MLSVIIPANNEAAYLGACLDALAAQTFDGEKEVVVSANACRDGTVAVAEGCRKRLVDAGWNLAVIDRAEPGKPGALNAADAVARGEIRVYLDADVVCSPALIGQLAAALSVTAPRYASGRLVLAQMKSAVTRRYSEIWTRLPFVISDVPGAGLFAVNKAGRARWGAFPDIIADDLFVRLNFAPDERIGVAASYSWPLVEGARALVCVRGRQDAGNAEIAQLYPHLLRNEGKSTLGRDDHLRLLAERPLDYLTYAAIRLAARFGRDGNLGRWTRGR